MRLFFIINSRHYCVREDVQNLRQHFGHEHEYRLTDFPGHAIELATYAINHRFTHIIAVGGDGTINEVINGMMNSEAYEDWQPVFTFLPRGSGNDLARTMGYDSSINSLYQRIEGNDIVDMDVGIARFSEGDRYFMNVMDLGLGGSIALKVETYRRGKWSFLAYQRAILSVLPFYVKQTITIESATFQYDGKALSAVIANGLWFGGGLGIAPDAKINDGLLNLVVIGNVGIAEYLYYLPRIMMGKKIIHKEVHYLELKSLTVKGNNLPCEMDGESSGTEPVEISVIPGKIKILQ
jgi:diacylglycerol kinase (ATP)